jgi:hypothetical protein
VHININPYFSRNSATSLRHNRLQFVRDDVVLS